MITSLGYAVVEFPNYTDFLSKKIFFYLTWICPSFQFLNWLLTFFLRLNYMLQIPGNENDLLSIRKGSETWLVIIWSICWVWSINSLFNIFIINHRMGENWWTSCWKSELGLEKKGIYYIIIFCLISTDGNTVLDLKTLQGQEQSEFRLKSFSGNPMAESYIRKSPLHPTLIPQKPSRNKAVSNHFLTGAKKIA